MSIDMVVKIVLSVITIASSLLTGILIPLIKAKTTQEQRDDTFEWVKIAVKAAEQMDAAGLITLPKKEYVLAFINQKFADKDIKMHLSIEDLDIMIEAAVNELNMMKEGLLEVN